MTKEDFKDLKRQAQIVYERLHYHFANVDGSWNIPEDMPFMKEFLNTVSKLVFKVRELELEDNNE